MLDSTTGAVGCESAEVGDVGFFQTDLRFSHEYVTPMAASFFEQKVGKGEPLTDPDTIIFFRDHLTFLEQAITPERRKMG